MGDRQDPRRGTEVDVWYRAQRLLVELDGRVGHAGSGRFRDMTRDNGAAERELQTLRHGYHDVVGEPCDVAAQVAAVLQLRGWREEPRPCPRCRLHAA